MRKYCDKLKGKLKSRKGMSLLELLCAVLILLLVSGGMTSAVSLAANQYRESMRNSESQVLYSSLKTVLSHELAYTTNILIGSDGAVKQFLPPNATLEHSLSTIMTDESGENGYGQIVFGNISDPTQRNPVLGKAAYTNGLLAKVKSITYSNDTNCFTIYLSIGVDGTEFYGGQFQVMNVNETEAIDAP